ncbi:MAG: LptF/LptG family permease [Armatimonadota bacterium]
MKTIDKYVLKEMIGPFLVSVFAFVVLLIGRVIFDNINFILEKKVPISLVVRLIVFQLPMIIGMVLPLATLFATALAVNRLGRESEITAIRMSGVPLRRIFLPIFIVGFFASIATLWIGESVTPWANLEAKKTMRFIWGLQPVPPVQENLFFQSEGYYFYIQKVERSSDKNVMMRKIMIYETAAPGSFPMFTTAETATNKDNLWILHNGVQHKLDDTGFVVYEMKFDRLELNLKRAIQALWDTQKTAEEMGFRELQEKISVFKGASQDVAQMKVDWHFKLSIPFSCLIFALCAAPLSLKFARVGSYSGILLGVIIMFLYWNNILLGKALGIGLLVPPALAGWSQNIIFGLGGLILLWREE